METEAEAISEDRRRIADATKESCKTGNEQIRRAIHRLISHISAAVEKDLSASTLASKTAMRMMRVRWVRDVNKLIAESEGLHVSFVTLLPRSGDIPDSGLESLDPNRIKKAFISRLNRRSIASCKGWLVGGLHGEYDSIAKVWRIHWHLMVCGEVNRVIDGLRKDADFKSGRGETPRIRVTRQPIKDVSRVASYVLQSWWPNRPKGNFAGDDSFHRKHRSRLPEPQQTRWLLWMHRRKLSDLVMMIGVRRTGSGFKITQL